MFNLLKLLASDTFSVFRWKIPLLISLMVISGILEGLAVASALPLLNLLNNRSDIVSNVDSSFSIVSILAIGPSFLGLPDGPIGIGLFMALLVCGSAIFYLFMARLSASLQVTYVLNWQTQIFKSSLSAGPLFLEKYRSGDVVASIVTEVSRVGGAFYHGSIFLASALNVLIYVGITLLISPNASISIIIAGLFLFLVTRPLMNRAFGYGKLITNAQSAIQILAEEGISLSKAIKINVAEEFMNSKFRAQAKKLAEANFRNSFDIQKAKTIFEFGGALAIASVLIVGTLYFKLEVSAILVVLALFVRLIPRISALQQSLQALNSLLPALSKIHEYRKQAQKASEYLDNQPLPKDLLEKGLSVELRNVCVKRGIESVLKNISVKIPSNKIVAIVGPSGSGKSTLVDTLLGLIPISSGDIFIGKTTLGDIPKSAWRRAIGYVTQDTTLVSGSIAENISFGKKLGDLELCDALDRSAAHFVKHLKEGIHTEVGSRGDLVSGGERQRISLARALALPRKLFIFDEATSALDSETEAEVLNTVMQLSGAATVIIIAHRFSAVKHADLILVMEEGKIIEQGDWNTLNLNGTRFHSFLKLQSLGSK